MAFIASRGSNVLISQPRVAKSFLRANGVLPRTLGRRASQRETAVRAAAAAPVPAVKIDNMSDSFATIVSVELGDHMDDMLDVITSLKTIGLNIRKAKLRAGAEAVPAAKNKFFITESMTSEKIVKSCRLEEIRQTVLSSLNDTLQAEGGTFLVGSPNDAKSKALGMRAVIPTSVSVREAPNGSCSLLKIVTQDRPGLLVEIVRVLKGINLNVVSAEVDTIGGQAIDIFFVTYRGEPLSNNITALATSALQYYLSLLEVSREESYQKHERSDTACSRGTGTV